MTPIINVQWEYAARLGNEVGLLKSEVNRQNARITANQVTLAEIQQQLADGVNAIGGGGGMGWPLFKNAQYYRFVLAPNVPTKIVEATPEATLRQLRFRLLTGTEVYLSGSKSNIGSDWSPLVLNSGMLFQDDHDGGENWYALAPSGATILIEIRTAEQAQQAGEDFVIPFKAEGILEANQFNFQVNQLFNDPFDMHYERLAHWFDGANGFRMLDITSFHPGQSYTLTVEVDSAFLPNLVTENDFANPIDPTYMTNGNPIRYGDKAIEIFMPNFYNNLPELTLAALSNFFNAGAAGSIQEQMPKLMGIIKNKGWVTSLPKQGGTISISPDFSRRFLVVYCRHNNSLFMDNARFTWDNVTKTITLVGA